MYRWHGHDDRRDGRSPGIDDDLDCARAIGHVGQDRNAASIAACTLVATGSTKSESTAGGSSALVAIAARSIAGRSNAIGAMARGSTAMGRRQCARRQAGRRPVRCRRRYSPGRRSPESVRSGAGRSTEVEPTAGAVCAVGSAVAGRYHPRYHRFRYLASGATAAGLRRRSPTSRASSRPSRARFLARLPWRTPSSYRTT